MKSKDWRPDQTHSFPEDIQGHFLQPQGRHIGLKKQEKAREEWEFAEEKEF